MIRNNSSKIKNIILLQLIVVIYTISSVISKLASSANFLSIKFIMLYSLEIIFLGIYAILWQQIIKKFDLSIAYANRAISILWSLLWSVLLFNETLTLKNIIGGFIIVIGTMIVNSDDN